MGFGESSLGIQVLCITICCVAVIGVLLIDSILLKFICGASPLWGLAAAFAALAILWLHGPFRGKQTLGSTGFGVELASISAMFANLIVFVLCALRLLGK